MKTQFTRAERWRMFWGFVYLLNVKTGEVHFLPGKTAQCGIDNMAAHNKKYLTTAAYKRMMKAKPPLLAINGCHWCNRGYDLE